MTLVDRLIELDFDALGPAASMAEIETVVLRLLPLWRDAVQTGGEAGLVLNLGWLMDPVVLYSGDSAQKLPIRSRRLAPYAQMTYAELGEVVRSIRSTASLHGVHSLRIGMLILGIGEFVNEIVRAPGSGTHDTTEAALYQESGEWFERHPELFPFPSTITLHGPGVDWRVPLESDSSVYAARPYGIVAGESFASFLSEQWSAVSRAVGFDLLLFRDEMTTPVHSGRMAFDTSSSKATATEIDEWTASLIRVTTAIKSRAPETMLVLYSSGLSPTVELQYGRLDIARVVAAGQIDAWIDQTWGGAWQDWWDAGWQGWSFQLTNLLARAALIAAGNAKRDKPCRHYPLIQLLDGWEPYDTLHDYPNKLKWGIWAFLHASTVACGRAIPPAGAYLAVANDRTGALIAKDDVAWVADTVSEASLSARHLERVLGPTLVVPDRRAAEGSSITAESVEDATGFLGKWGIPVLTSSTGDALPSAPSGPTIEAAVSAVLHGRPALIVGAPEDLPPPLRDVLGVVVHRESAPSGYRRGIATNTFAGIKASAWPYMGRRRKTAPTDAASTIYDGEDGPTAMRRLDMIWWLPPHVANSADRRLTHYQVGTVDPHVAVAHAFAALLAENGDLWVEAMATHETVAVHGWVSGGTVHLLLGNVESGWIGDSRFGRTVIVHLPAEFVSDFESPVLAIQGGSWSAVVGGVVAVAVPAEGFALGRLRERSEIENENEDDKAEK